MKNFLQKYIRTCPKTGRIIGIKGDKGLSRLLFPFIGLAAMLWILIRVIPKPSRLSYPCVRTAMPIASGFLGYLVTLALSAVAFVRFKKPLRYYPVFFVATFAVFGMCGFYLIDADTDQQVVQNLANATVEPNAPMGVAKGIIPGRVVWVHDSSAVKQNCTISSWYLSTNMNQAKVDQMLSSALRSVTGQTTDSAAWVAIFQYHNTTRGRGPANYVKGEKIFIKTNATSAYQYGPNLTPVSNVSETSVASVLAVLRQLVNVVGVADSDIYVGDPMKHIYKHLYDVWHKEFSHVHYLDNSGDYTNLGREQVVPSSTAIIHYSDNGTVLQTNQMSSGTPGDPVYQDNLYTIFETADYILNIPMMKGHQRAGITMFAKNHFGSHTRGDASHLHLGLVSPYGTDHSLMRTDYGMYRVQVDLMTHKLLSGKNLLYIMDALWSTDWELDKPLKWKMAPFNNRYTSSIFVSFDPVAIESVGYDFIRSEFVQGSGKDLSVQMPAVDDYLHQAADSNNWPVDYRYDPNGTGEHVYSLGVHEHWNNDTAKQYSRNIDPISGSGIELIEIEQTGTGVASRENGPEYFQLYQNYPNPFNPSTTIAYSLPEKSSVAIKIYDLRGREIKSFTISAQSAGYQRVVWNGTNDRGNPISSGVYVYRVRAASLVGGKIFERSSKMLLLK